MTTADYKPFVERMVERYEGGYGWDADDPGGPTKYGITCYDLAEFEGKTMTSMTAWAPLVQAMSLSTADEIYQVKYATACAFNALDAGCDCVVFDFGVNSGPARAVRYAQSIVNVSVDGILGPVTLRAINSYSANTFINALCDERLAFLRSLSIWKDFGVGWTARVADLRSYALALLQPKAPAIPMQPQPKIERIPFAFAKGYTIADHL